MEKLFSLGQLKFFPLYLFSFVFYGKWKRLYFDASASGLGRGAECWVSEVDLARLEGDLYLFSCGGGFCFPCICLEASLADGSSGSSSFHSSLIDVHDLKV